MHAVKITRRSLIAGAAAAAGTPALARPVTPPGSRGAQVSSAGEITTFVIQNHDNASSLGLKRIGLVFKDGDVPAGSRVSIRRGGVDIAAQFDQRSTYPSGALRFCVAKIRDGDFSGGESRTYSVIGQPGAFDNASALTLSAVTGATNFRVEFTSLAGFSSGALPDHLASFNAHAAVPTRVMRYESGPICDSWQVWGMAANGGTPHAHLKTIWYVTRWKNAVGALMAHEICAVVALDWWAVPGKEKLTYTSTLKNGAVTIETYGGSIDSKGVRSATIEHPYQSQWATVRLQDDNQHGARHWIGGTARPTLLYKPNRSYWIKTGLVPPLILSKNFTMPAGYVNGPVWGGIYQPRIYQPCSAQAHRPGEKTAGGYPGRGLLPNMDCIAFVSPTAQNIRVMRVNSLVGLHYPGHRRSEKRRTRPGEGTDVANTICPLIMLDERGAALADARVPTGIIPTANRGVGTPASFSDFTADGMPAAANAYATTTSISLGTSDGWVKPAGTQTSGTSVWIAAGNYGQAGSSSHAVSHSYLGYLWEGERYLLEAILDGGMNVIQQRHGDSFGGLPKVDNNGTYPGIPDTQWAGIGLRCANVPRTLAWGAMLLSRMTILPDDDVQANYVKRLVALNAKYTAHTAGYMPASCPGLYWGGNQAAAPWMDAFIPQACYMAADITGDPNWLPIAAFCAKGPLSWGQLNKVGHAACYHAIGRPRHNTAWSPSNDWFHDGLYEQITVNIGPDSVLTALDAAHPWPFVAGDEVMFTDTNRSFKAVAPPPEVTIGVKYYMVGPRGSAGFRVSATPNGTPIAFASGHAGVGIGIRLANAGDTTKKGAPLGADSYGPISRAAVVMAKRHGHPLASNLVMNRYNTYYADTNDSQWATWSLSEMV